MFARARVYRRGGAIVLATTLAFLVIVFTVAASVVHIYPSTGYSTYYSYPSGLATCYFQGYDWSHSIQVGIHGYYPQTQVQVQIVNPYNGWENSPWDFVWGATWLVDGTNANNTQTYIEPLGYAFTSSPSFYPYKNLNYQNPGYNPYVMSQWGYAGSRTCQAQSYVVIHGPN